MTDTIPNTLSPTPQKSLWQSILSPFQWLKRQWDKFETWVASIAPGVKTKTAAALTLIGNAAYYTKDWVDQLPIQAVTQYITADALVIFNLVLVTLIYWFRRLANKEA